MAIKVTLRNASNVTTSQVSSIDGTLVFSRSIYQLLGSLVKNKTIKADYEAGTLPEEYMIFLTNMNSLSIDGGIGLKDLPSYLKMSEYLSSLGVTQEYSYSKDIVNIPIWMVMEGESAQTRVIVDYSDDTYLIDPEDNTILVRNLGD